ncbi:MAG: hypothetical protein WAJ82_02655, partial [Azonexus sp.]
MDANYQIALSYRGHLRWLCGNEKRGRSPVRVVCRRRLFLVLLQLLEEVRSGVLLLATAVTA